MIKVGSVAFHVAWLTLTASLVEGQAGRGPVPGVIHFEDGSRLPFHDLLKIRVGPSFGAILLEPRGIYVQQEFAAVLVPASQMRELAVVDFRLATRSQCRSSCGIHTSRLAVVTAAGTMQIKVGFADSVIVSVRDDNADHEDVRAVPWAVVRGDTVRLHIRRIVFGTGNNR